MGATYDDREVHETEARHTHGNYWTTIVLEKRDDGRWLATQGDVKHRFGRLDALVPVCIAIVGIGSDTYLSGNLAHTRGHGPQNPSSDGDVEREEYIKNRGIAESSV